MHDRRLLVNDVRPVRAGRDQFDESDPDMLDTRLMGDDWEPPYRTAPDGQPPTDNEITGCAVRRRLFLRKGVSNG